MKTENSESQIEGAKITIQTLHQAYNGSISGKATSYAQ
jgi:hypothetical protein